MERLVGELTLEVPRGLAEGEEDGAVVVGHHVEGVYAGRRDYNGDDPDESDNEAST